MTTHITISNEKDSNPCQMVYIHGFNLWDGPNFRVLKVGESENYGISTASILIITERDDYEQKDCRR
jgi:hypothetical protein